MQAVIIRRARERKRERKRERRVAVLSAVNIVCFADFIVGAVLATQVWFVPAQRATAAATLV